MRGVPGRRVGELARLRGGGIGELLAAVADVDAEQRRQRVEIPVAALVPALASLAADEDRHVLVAADRGEVAPQMATRRALQRGRRGPFVYAAGHVGDPRQRARRARRVGRALGAIYRRRWWTVRLTVAAVRVELPG